MFKTFAASSVLALCTAAQSTITTIPIATGLSKPIAMTAPPGDQARLFVVEQTGKIRVISHGSLHATPFLDVTSVMSASIGELGLFSLAFHPAYASNGRFFVFYTRVGDLSGVLAEYAVSANPNVAQPNGSVVLVTPPSTSGDHQGGCLQFGLDGMLYIATGDGGSNVVGDPECDAQNGLSLLGKLLRIDVDGAAPYAVPADNPFVGNSNFLPEIWAYGLRHPWRYSFDRATGDLYLGDVGQQLREEVNYAPFGASGMNFGWNVMEAETCTGYAACAGAPACQTGSLTLPVWHYTHALSHCAMIGGHVYRGCRIPSLNGAYFFADYCSRKIYSLEVVGGVATNVTDRTAELAPAGGGTINQICAFGEDANGELYICDRTGKLWQIVPVDDCSITSYGTSNVNSTGVAAHIDKEGVASICASDLVITGTGLPPSVTCLLFFSATQLLPCLPFGNGTRCVGGSIKRVPPVSADALGNVAIPFGSALTSLHGLTSNDVRFFQMWFRDPTGGGSHTNTTEGLEIVFCQ